MPLKVGNQWIYETRQIDQMGNVESMVFDTVEVVAREVVNGLEQYRLSNSSFHQSQEFSLYFDQNELRSGFSGNILLSIDPLIRDTVFHHGGTQDTVATSFYALESTETISVPAGEFETLYFVGEFIRKGQATRFIGDELYYAEGIGRVLQRTWYLSRTAYIEQRLISYSLVK